MRLFQLFFEIIHKTLGYSFSACFGVVYAYDCVEGGGSGGGGGSG